MVFILTSCLFSWFLKIIFSERSLNYNGTANIQDIREYMRS
jgi:hypothetical protein